MITPEPSSNDMRHALIAHRLGGPAIKKDALYLHSEREAIALAQGYESWDEKHEHDSQKTIEFLNRLEKGELDE